MTPVVLLHFHRRRTGVTRHVEDVARRLPAHVIGWGPLLGVRRLPWRALLDLARSGPLVVHAHRNLELLAALLLRSARHSVRVVFTRHSAGRPSGWTRFLARRADARVVLTRVALRELGFRAEVVPHGVDVKRFSPPADRGQAWGSLGVGGSHGVGAVGRVRPSKGQQDLAAAWAVLGPRFPRWRAVLVGLVTRRWRGFAGRLGGLQQLGELDDTAALYRGLTILLQPSRQESFSLVLLEAMASGCCVVAAALPHYPELVEHGVTGFLYPAGDVSALVEILEPLLAEPSRAKAVGRAAVEDVRARWTLDAEVEALRGLYARLERLR
ncbi:MAG TPA: glycosyltransferase family 4 protein [Myxococcaceae bacterium]|nr:glycosyltransferase family 4 protein [Myxococcaceae bacterium]